MTRAAALGACADGDRRRLVVCVAILSPVLSATASSFGAAQLDQPARLVAEQRARRRPAGVLRAESAASAVRIAHRSTGSRRCPADSTRTSRRCPGSRCVTIVGAVIVVPGSVRIKGWVVFTGVFALARARAVHRCRAAADLRADAVGAAALPADHRRRADADAHDDPRDARRLDAARHGRAAPAQPLAPSAAADAGIGALLLFELLPAPRDAALGRDARPSIGSSPPIPGRSACCRCRSACATASARAANYSSSSQFYQTFHEKRLVGGYISRLPGDSIERYRRNSTLRVLLRLSEGTPVEPELLRTRLARARTATLRRLKIGYVVIDPAIVSELVEFAHGVPDDARARGGGLDLYRTPLAPPEIATRQSAVDSRQSSVTVLSLVGSSSRQSKSSVDEAQHV